jgi:hypothetical protein
VLLCCWRFASVPSFSSITELPYNFGYLLPSLLELNLAWNDLPLLPGSICTIPKLRCLSVVSEGGRDGTSVLDEERRKGECGRILVLIRS